MTEMPTVARSARRNEREAANSDLIPQLILWIRRLKVRAPLTDHHLRSADYNFPRAAQSRDVGGKVASHDENVRAVSLR